jgi:hypothetical protein
MNKKKIIVLGILLMLTQLGYAQEPSVNINGYANIIIPVANNASNPMASELRDSAQEWGEGTGTLVKK